MAIDIEFLNNNSVANITANFERVEAALADALSRSGSTPNQMEGDLDLNDYNIINAGEILSGSISAGDYVTYAEEWANADEDTLVSVAAGGNGSNEYSSKHWASKAGTSASTASSSATSAQSSASSAALSALEMQSLIDAVEAGQTPRDYGTITNISGETEDYGSIV